MDLFSITDIPSSDDNFFENTFFKYFRLFSIRSLTQGDQKESKSRVLHLIYRNVRLTLSRTHNYKGCSFNILVASPMEIFCFEKRMSQR
jgi:hypothetical protein